MILITGATGLIGSFITHKLIAEGEKIRILTRKTSNLQPLSNIISQIDVFEGDILDIPSLEKAYEGVDQIIHCAAVVSFGDVGIDRLFKVNVEGTKNVVNVALDHKIAKLIYLSSIAAIGRDPKLDSIDENTLWVESDFNSMYAKSKYAAELEVWRGIEEGLCAAIVNPSIVLGPSNWNKSSTKIFKNVYQGMVFYPSGYTNLVDVRDVVDAICLLRKSNIAGERYIISGHSTSYHDFFTQIAAGFGKKPPFIKLSKGFALLAYFILRIFAPFYLQKRFINRETIVISSQDFHYSNQKFKKAFDFTYRPLHESIAWVCNCIERTT